MIRTFESKDLAEVMNIWLHANIDAHSFIPSDYWMNQFDFVKSLIPNADVYVSEKSGIIDGFIGLIDDDIAGIFVTKPDRSSGIGSELLNTAKAHNHKLHLSVYAKNKSALRFYEKAGFHIEAHKTDPDTNENEYTMTWEP